MEGRRRNNHRRSQNKKPPRGSWQPTVPAWEKEFCKVVGSMEWDTLVQMKKFVHLYDNVIEWNDSAAEEAFCNAKRRYWAMKNSLSCDISLPDPDLYIDNINWDSDTDPDPELLSDVESLPTSPKTEEDHDPVVIFDSFALLNQGFAPTGWGDDEVAPPLTHSSANNVDPWGYSSNEWAAATWPGYSNDGWQSYSSDAWGGEHGYMPWEGDWSNWNWNNANICSYAGPDVRDTWEDYHNIPTAGWGEHASSLTTRRAQANKQRRKHMPRNGEGHDKTPYRRSSTRDWNSNSIAVGQTWDQE